MARKDTLSLIEHLEESPFCFESIYSRPVHLGSHTVAQLDAFYTGFGQGWRMGALGQHWRDERHLPHREFTVAELEGFKERDTNGKTEYAS